MALTTVPSLFGGSMMTPEQVQQQELQGMMISPAQMAQLSLPQQITATIAGAGSGIGYAGGRMMGGQTADMVRANTLNQIMQDVTSAGYTSDAEMYNALAQKLAQAGMAQDAMTARAKALEARRVEQSMTLANREDIRAQERADMLRELHPANKTKAALEVTRLQQLTTTIDERIANAQADLAEDPNNTQVQARLAGLTRERANEQAKLDMERKKLDAQINHWKVLEQQGATTAKIAQARIDMERYSKQATISVKSPDPLDRGKMIQVKVGWMDDKTGKVLGQDGQIYPNARAAAEAQQLSGDNVPGVPVQADAETAKLQRQNNAARPPFKNFFGSNAAGNMETPAGY